MFPASPDYRRWRFSSNRVNHLYDALRYCADRELEKGNLQGRLIENLAVVVAAVQGNKNPESLRFVNPYGMLIYQQLAKESIGAAAAKTAIELRGQERIPNWVMATFDWQMIEAAAA
jgi:hypothetical protein